MQEKGIHDGHRKRLRQRFIDCSLDAFSDHEVFELILTYSIPRRDVNELAHKLLDHFGSFSGVFNASVDELVQVEGISTNSAVLISLFAQVTGRYTKDMSKDRFQINNVKSVFEFGKTLYTSNKYERFYVICLDSKCRLIKAVSVAEGTIDSAVVYPRIVLEKCLTYNAHGVILMHNHPSGDPSPSRKDVEVTESIAKALHNIGIRVYDHMIIGNDKFYSFNHNGIMKEIEQKL